MAPTNNSVILYFCYLTPNQPKKGETPLSADFMFVQTIFYFLLSPRPASHNLFYPRDQHRIFFRAFPVWSHTRNIQILRITDHRQKRQHMHPPPVDAVA